MLTKLWKLKSFHWNLFTFSNFSLFMTFILHLRFAPFHKKTDVLYAFAPDLCRSLGASFVRYSQYNGVPTGFYSIDLGDLKVRKKNANLISWRLLVLWVWNVKLFTNNTAKLHCACWKVGLTILFGYFVSAFFIQFDLEWSEPTLLLQRSGRRKVCAQRNVRFVI